MHMGRHRHLKFPHSSQTLFTRKPASVCLLYPPLKRNERTYRQRVRLLVLKGSHLLSRLLPIHCPLVDIALGLFTCHRPMLAGSNNNLRRIRGPPRAKPVSIRDVNWEWCNEKDFSANKEDRPAKVRTCVNSLVCCIAAIVNLVYGAAAAELLFIGFVLCWLPIA